MAIDPRSSKINDASVLATNGNTESGLVGWAQALLLKTDRLFRFLLILLIVLVSLNLLSIVWQFASFYAGLLLLFFAAWMVALILTPPVKLLMRLGWPKMLAVGAAFVLLFSGITMLLLLFLPGLISQTQDLVRNLSTIGGQLQKNIDDILKNLGLTGVNTDQIFTQFLSFGGDVLKNALSTATGIVGLFIQVLLVMIIAFSLLAGREYESPRRKKPISDKPNSLWSHLPINWRKWAQILAQSFERNFGVFLGGQVAVGLAYGFFVGVLMSFTGFPYAVTTGCFCGLLMMIPFFGGPLSLIPPIIVAIGGKVDGPIWFVLVTLYIVQTILLNVVLPKLAGRGSGIGPVTSLFFLLAGAQVGGIWGVLLAVPLAGVAKNMLDYALAQQEANAAAAANVVAVAAVLTPTNGAVNGSKIEVVTETLVTEPLAEPPSQVEIALEALVKTPDKE